MDARLLAVALLASSALLVGCRSQVASADECADVARHLAELQVKKEKQPPHGRLAIKPFDTMEHEGEIRAEALEGARGRCAKGWKREVVACMLQAKAIDEADKCRSL